MICKQGITLRHASHDPSAQRFGQKCQAQIRPAAHLYHTTWTQVRTIQSIEDEEGERVQSHHLNDVGLQCGDHVVQPGDDACPRREEAFLSLRVIGGRNTSQQVSGAFRFVQMCIHTDLRAQVKPPLRMGAVRAADEKKPDRQRGVRVISSHSSDASSIDNRTSLSRFPEIRRSIARWMDFGLSPSSDSMSAWDSTRANNRGPLRR